MATDAHRCGKCGVAEGKLHELGCGMERCRECGGQFISCDCVIQHFYPNGLPREVFENGLSDKEDEKQEAEWLAHIETLGGRVPHIDWPNLCARCGKLWPEFFQVSDEEWARYIEPGHRHDVVCAECYEFIKSAIGGGNMTLEQQLQELADRGGGQKTIHPRQDQDLEAFKATISELEGYEAECRLVIIRRHQESHTGQRYFDRVTVELTPDNWPRRV